VPPSLPTKALGRTGLEVTFPALGGVGLGGVNLADLYGGVSEREAVDAVLTAVSRGINFIDTAPLYMESERRVGVALTELAPEVRDNLVIATKVCDECEPYSNNGGHDAFSAAGVRCSIENSLRVLGLDSVDVVLVHDTTPQVRTSSCTRTRPTSAFCDSIVTPVVSPWWCRSSRTSWLRAVAWRGSGRPRLRGWSNT
jgi:aryl-alcohol dehydrogenase-like predicted oxidoreductase